MSQIAGIAQMVEQLICNQKVVGSIPTVGTSYPVERQQIANFLPPRSLS